MNSTSNIHDAENPRNVDQGILIARGRLKDGRKWFTHRGWDTLPQNERGQRILQWVADHAWRAYPSNPEAAIRRICKPLATWLSVKRLEQLVKATKASNKRWSHDHSAVVLEITVADCLTHGFRFLGAADDPDYDARHKATRARKAANARKRRAAKSTGRPRGRPPSRLSAEERLIREREQNAERQRRCRASRKNASPYNIKKNVRLRILA